MPLVPVPKPSISKPLIVTMAVLGVGLVESLMLIPNVPAPSTPPIQPSHLIVIDLVTVTLPNPPESRQLISPPSAVFEIAPAKVLHGAVRLHGLASSPTPDTHVLVACACANVLHASKTTNTANILNSDFILVIVLSFTFKAI